MAVARQTQFRAPSGRTLFDWFTGTGFLAVDAGAFFVALMVLLPWNLYRSPGDLWVAQPLRTWAFILTFHALVVGAIALARGIVRSPEPEPATVPRAGLRASSSWSAPQPQQPNRQTASTLLAQEWARRWLEDDRAEVAGMVQHSEEISTRRTRVIYPMTTDPAEFTPWPDAPVQRTSIDAEAILADWLDEQASEYVPSPAEAVDPLKSAARVRKIDADQTGTPLDPELEWKWVEAAASAWLSKRDLSPNGNAESNGHA